MGRPRAAPRRAAPFGDTRGTPFGIVRDKLDPVLEFRFERDIVPGYHEVRPVWLGSTPAFDAEIAQRFGPTYERDYVSPGAGGPGRP